MTQLLTVQYKKVNRTVKLFSYFQKNATKNLQFVTSFNINELVKIYEKSK